MLENSADRATGAVTIRVTDNSCGMTAEILRRILNNFNIKTDGGPQDITLAPLITEIKHGKLKIETLRQGTLIEVVWTGGQIDCPPPAEIAETVKTLIINNPDKDIVYSQSVNGNKFWVATNLINAILADESLTHPAVGRWLHNYLTDNIARLYHG